MPKKPKSPDKTPYVGQNKQEQDCDNPRSDTRKAVWSLQPILCIVKDLQMLILADRRPDRQRRLGGIALQRFGQTELIF